MEPGELMETLLTCRKFDVRREVVTGTDGARHTREYVIHPGAVVVLALPDADHCLMLRQLRPAIGQEIWELPAGTLDIPSEPAEDAAARELEEEAGVRAGKLTRLCEFFPSPGITSEKIVAYVAEDLTTGQQALGPTEQIHEVKRLPIVDAMRMAMDGRIVDAKTMITLMVWDAQRRRHG